MFLKCLDNNICIYFYNTFANYNFLILGMKIHFFGIKSRSFKLFLKMLCFYKIHLYILYLKIFAINYVNNLHEFF